MENASKALIIAGSVLLMMLLLTFGLIIFKRIGAQSTDIYEKLGQSKIDEFNQSFYKYETKLSANDNKPSSIRIQDVVTIFNLAESYNQSQRYPVKVKVMLDGVERNYGSDELKQLLLADSKSNNRTEYRCRISMAENSQLVGLVQITTINQ